MKLEGAMLMVNNVVNVIPIIAYLASSMTFEMDHKRGEWFIIHAAVPFCLPVFNNNDSFHI